MSTLGAALREEGTEVTLACAPAFAGLADRHGLDFTELTVTRNANTGVAERTSQAPSEGARLREFLEATREGAIPALLTQARHRAADMLPDPERVLEDVRALDRRSRADWYLVDQLSYPVTLSMHCLELPYATFCPGHPSYIPTEQDASFGLPRAWPDALRPAPGDLDELLVAVNANDRAFTRAFRDVARAHAPHLPEVERAFALCSPRAVVFNYPRLPDLPPPPSGPTAIYSGHCTPLPLETGPDGTWQAVVARLGSGGRPLVLVAFGTFLSARHDVLRTVTEAVLTHTEASVIVAAGDRLPELLSSPVLACASPDRLHLADTVPQQQLLAHCTAMVHHGGNNSFTECVAAGVPSLVLPFSSDQFAIGHDVERAGLGLTLDPNTATAFTVGTAVKQLLAAPGDRTKSLAHEVLAAGPRHAARQLLDVMPGGPLTS
ncbi:nucleotide disphospho-sugar-binding domain-containing protein [Kitasatospora sp. NPDC101801]|uniref:nucleotide disphospho-sugar-binding domain-containing protein n=1 Tax=Kitasatospora sp. NPDC101801 TaxID=3364103 RepID=UPI003820B855